MKRKYQKKFQKGSLGLSLPIIILIVIAGLIIVFWKIGFSPKPIINQKASSGEAWTETGVAIAGRYADADVIDLGNGKFRLYYSAEPETPGFQGQVYSAISSDGINWSQETGTRITLATFPSAIKLSDGKYRMYFQDNRVIKSALSADGISWEREQGIRIDTQNPAGLTLTGVLAPTVIQTGNEYLMVYAGAINQPYEKEKVPNRETHPLLWATSTDGLVFEQKGIALDSRNEVFKGWMDGPELVAWDDNIIKLYLWGYFGVYESIFENGNFSEPKFVFYGPNLDKNALFPSSPPGDPTLVKIGDTWNMFYGYFQKGIYRAVLN
ncbi:MAG: hypothetical protein HW400_501 [Candidatus Levybacteria bacterium]|nr:hypothetical protein [Candidatus Levybacteria bacterium]